MGNDKLINWEKQSVKSKSILGRPKPSGKYICENNYNLANNEKRIRGNYALLKIKINYVDQLLIKNQFFLEGDWLERMKGKKNLYFLKN
tara:strand:- start:842 stop:1108 length:267 start_codon:yes stop_codon:yes gene_type:complete